MVNSRPEFQESIGAHAALFVDFDNIALAAAQSEFDGLRAEFVPWPVIVRYLAKRLGLAFGVRKAYGDFLIHTRAVIRQNIYKGTEIRELIRRDEAAQAQLLEEGFELVLSPPHGGGRNTKNRADMLITIDVLSVTTLYPQIQAFCILSGDSDFTPVFQRLKALGKRVYAISYRNQMSSLLASVADGVVWIDQELVDWGALIPLRQVVNHWLTDETQRERMTTGIHPNALIEAIRGDRSGIEPSWFGFGSWTEFLDEIIEDLIWPDAAGGKWILKRDGPNRLILAHPTLSAPPLASTNSRPMVQPTPHPGRREELLAALNRRNANPSPYVREQVIEWLHGNLTSGEPRTLQDITRQCVEMLGTGENTATISKGKVRQIVSALARAGAFLDSNGSPVSVENVQGAFSLPLVSTFLAGDVVRDNLNRFYVRTVRTEDRLAAASPVTEHDAVLLAGIIHDNPTAADIAQVRDCLMQSS